MSVAITLPRTALAEVSLLALAETCLIAIQNAQPDSKSDRSTRLKCLLRDLTAIDATYRGKFPMNWTAPAERAFSDIEARINQMFEEIGNV